MVVGTSSVLAFSSNTNMHRAWGRLQPSRPLLSQGLQRILLRASWLCSIIFFSAWSAGCQEITSSPSELEAVHQAIAESMVFVETGSFEMGSDRMRVRYASELPVHPVAVSSFQIGKYEITQAQWRAVMGSNPSDFENCDDCPVENVSWNDAQVFITTLNQQTKRNYRLPTEAEWEFAARGGRLSQGYRYAGSNRLRKVAWHEKNSGRRTHPVGTKAPNELGLYDMSGNVWEWCQDVFVAYTDLPQTDPIIEGVEGPRVLRGGGWHDRRDFNRVTYRNALRPKYAEHRYGLRLALPISSVGL